MLRRLSEAAPAVVGGLQALSLVQADDSGSRKASDSDSEPGCDCCTVRYVKEALCISSGGSMAVIASALPCLQVRLTVMRSLGVRGTALGVLDCPSVVCMAPALR